MKLSNKSFIIYAVLLIVLFAVATCFKYITFHEQLPEGCDEFGYLNMAKAFNNNKAFKDHAPRPFLQGLTANLEKEGIPEKEYLWMIVPHAYHLSDRTNYKVINQYAPGTSYIISWLPIKYRQKIFPAIVVFLTLLVTFFVALYYLKLNYFQTLISITIIGVILHLSPPFGTEMARINSLALTFGLFIIVGLTAKEKPLIALFCISLASNFRVVNLLMLLPLLYFFLPPVYNRLKNKEYHSFIIFTLKASGALLLGLLPYVYYMFNLLGNPLLPTYPAHDTSFGTFTSYYFNFSAPWFLAHLVIVFTLFLLSFYKKISISELLGWMLFPIINYLFFSAHSIQMNYYPFASFFILMGATIYYFSKTPISFLQHKLVLTFTFIIVVILSIDGVGRYYRNDHISYEKVVETIQPLCSFDVVWGERKNSTAEYVCNNSGFKYDFGTTKSRIAAIKYLKTNNYSQVILCDDAKTDVKEIKSELDKYHINYKLTALPKLGRIIIIN